MTAIRPAIDRVMEQVTKTETCWLWTGFTTPRGYGSLGMGGRGAMRRPVHSIVWEAHNGPVPDGLELDHLCRVRNCVRPDHLEAVTHAENLRRRPAFTRALKTHCVRGHHLTDANVYLRTNRRTGVTRRLCRQCKSIWNKQYRDARTAITQSTNEGELAR